MSVERLKLKLPDGPNQNLNIDTVPVIISAVDAAITLAELATGAELALIGWPVAIGGAFFGSFLALGSGYAEARETIAADRLAMGYCYGLLMACDGRKRYLVTDYFWEEKAEYGYDFVDGGTLAQNSFNGGLVTGYWQGFELSQSQKMLIWRDILIRTGKIGTMKSEVLKGWGKGQWINWYREMGASWRRYHMMAQ